MDKYKKEKEVIALMNDGFILEPKTNYLGIKILSYFLYDRNSKTEYFLTVKTQKGIVRRSDQREAFRSVLKSLVWLQNDDLTPRLNDKGEELFILKSNDLLTVKGFID